MFMIGSRKLASFAFLKTFSKDNIINPCTFIHFFDWQMLLFKPTCIYTVYIVYPSPFACPADRLPGGHINHILSHVKVNDLERLD